MTKTETDANSVLEAWQNEVQTAPTPPTIAELEVQAATGDRLAQKELMARKLTVASAMAQDPHRNVNGGWKPKS